MIVHVSHLHALAIAKDLYQADINGRSFYASLR